MLGYKLAGKNFTSSEYAASVSQMAKPATPCSSQNWRACCWKRFARLRNSGPGGDLNATYYREQRSACTEVEQLDDSSASPVTFTSQMSKTTFRPAGTKEICFLLRILLGICVGRPSLTQVVAICEQVLDLSDAGPELIGRGGAESKERVAKHALQDQSPRTQGLKVG